MSLSTSKSLLETDEDFTCMNGLMGLLVGKLKEGLLAKTALIRPLPRVGPLVHFEVVVRGEGFLAKLALIPVNMRLFVGLQPVGRDRFVTELTGNLLFGMVLFVLLQSLFAPESLGAVGAEMICCRFVGRCHVTGQALLLVKRFVTEFTFERLLVTVNGLVVLNELGFGFKHGLAQPAFLKNWLLRRVLL